jgi:hypothetical protein
MLNLEPDSRFPCPQGRGRHAGQRRSGVISGASLGMQVVIIDTLAKAHDIDAKYHPR